MPSFGECQLLIENWVIGEVTIQDVFHGAAVFPRVCFRLGISLHELPHQRLHDAEPVASFYITELRGELRLDEKGPALGLLERIGTRSIIRSAAHRIDCHIEIACELDWARLDAIEEWRAGGELALWLVLWPSMANKEGYLSCSVLPIRAVIPRQRWLDFLGSVTGTRRTLVEITVPTLAAPEFQASMGHLQDARQKVNQGSFDEAVVCCRRAIEALLVALNIPNKAPVLQELLTTATDAERAKEYAGILARLKNLGNMTVHREEAAELFMRSEALFVVASTTHFVALMATLLGPRME